MLVHTPDTRCPFAEPDAFAGSGFAVDKTPLALQPARTRRAAGLSRRHREQSPEPLKLRFAQHLYGPYADNLRHVLVRLEGHYIDGHGDGTDPVTQFTPIRLRRGIDYPALDAESLAHLDRTMQLCAGFSTPFGMQLLGSVHWIATHDQQVVDAATCAERLWAWNERKRRLFKDRHVRVAWDALAAAGWLASSPAGPDVAAAPSSTPDPQCRIPTRAGSH